MERNEDLVDRTLTLGISCFQCHDYHKAISLFTKAIQLSQTYSDEDIEIKRISFGLSRRCIHDSTKVYHPRYLALLDNRAASWEKLNNLNKALKDGKRMIKVDPFNMKGYIRCGKILQKLNKNQDALENYTKAIEVSKHVFQKYKIETSKKFTEVIHYQLQLTKSRIRGSLSFNDVRDTNTKKRQLITDSKKQYELNFKVIRKNSDGHLDFVSQLPMEIVLLIFSYLETVVIIRCLEVSKLWYSRLMYLSMVIKEINLLRANYKKVSKFLIFSRKHYINQDRIRLKTISFSACGGSDEKKSLQLLFSNLRCTFKNVILHTSSADLTSVCGILLKNKSVLNQIEQFSLLSPYINNSNDFKEYSFLNEMRALKKLEIILHNSYACMNDLPSPVEFYVPDFDIHILNNLQTLKLILKDNNNWSSPPFAKLLQPGYVFNNLRKLYISGFKFDNSMTDCRWLLNFPLINDLWLEKNPGLKLIHLINILSTTPIFNALEKLIMREYPNAFLNMTNNYPSLIGNLNMSHNLKHLYLLDIMDSELSYEILMAIIQIADVSYIRKLNLGNCKGISFDRSHLSILDQIFQNLPKLEELLLPNAFELDYVGVKCIVSNMKYMKYIKKIDLSFNPSIQGTDILILFQDLKENNRVLSELCIDSCPSISLPTVQYMKAQMLVKSLTCSYDKLRWEVFGQNSFWYQ